MKTQSKISELGWLGLAYLVRNVPVILGCLWVAYTQERLLTAGLVAVVAIWFNFKGYSQMTQLITEGAAAGSPSSQRILRALHLATMVLAGGVALTVLSTLFAGR